MAQLATPALISGQTLTILQFVTCLGVERKERIVKTHTHIYTHSAPTAYVHLVACAQAAGSRTAIDTPAAYACGVAFAAGWMASEAPSSVLLELDALQSVAP